MTTHHFQGHTLFQGLLFLQEVLTEVHTIIFQSRCRSQSQNLRGREIEETLSNSAEKIPFSWLLFGSRWKKQHWGGLQWNTLGRKSPDSLDWSDTQSILFFKALPSFSSSTTSSDEAVVPAAVHFHSKHNLPCSCGEGLSRENHLVNYSSWFLLFIQKISKWIEDEEQRCSSPSLCLHCQDHCHCCCSWWGQLAGSRLCPFLTGVAAALLNVMTLLAAAELTPVLRQQCSFASLKNS